MRSSKPKAMSGIMDAMIIDLGIGPRLKKAEVIDKWSEVVGEHISKVTKPLRIDGETLFVHVTSSSWRNELTFLKKELIARVNEAVGKKIIKEIIFR